MSRTVRAIGPLVDRSAQPGGFGPPEGTRPSDGFIPEIPQTDGGDPDRAAAVGARAQRHETGGDRRRRPAGGPAGAAAQVPRVARGAEERVHRVALVAQLRGVRLADHDAARRLQPLHEGGVGGGDRAVGVHGATPAWCGTRPRPRGPSRRSGCPASGPTSSPAATRASSAAASASACSPSRATNAFTLGSISSMRSRAARHELASRGALGAHIGGEGGDGGGAEVHVGRRYDGRPALCCRELSSPAAGSTSPSRGSPAMRRRTFSRTRSLAAGSPSRWCWRCAA